MQTSPGPQHSSILWNCCILNAWAWNRARLTQKNVRSCSSPWGKRCWAKIITELEKWWICANQARCTAGSKNRKIPEQHSSPPELCLTSEKLIISLFKWEDQMTKNKPQNQTHKTGTVLRPRVLCDHGSVRTAHDQLEDSRTFTEPLIFPPLNQPDTTD